jgi:hypothetical protein
MACGRLVLAQVMDFFPRRQFDRIVRRYNGNKHIRNFTCYDQFLAMAFAQLTFRESLRDIQSCLLSFRPKLYHAGFKGPVARSTLADANESREWKIYADLAQALIKKARELYAGEDIGFSFKEPIYAFDSTTIDLCLSLFPWARFRKKKGAIKLHTLLDLRGAIPCFIWITDGKVNDIRSLAQLNYEAGAYYVMDRAYIDFLHLYEITQSLAFFVVRGKHNLDYHRISSSPVERATGLRSDQTIRLRGPKSSKLYPQSLRRITFRDPDSQKRFMFLTNNFQLSPLTIAELYKSRWQIELFFKWIKQHLRIKAFYGNSPNAVKTQVWIAVSTYLMILILKKQLKIDRSLAEILQILSLSLFEQVPIYDILTSFPVKTIDTTSCKPLNLFEI